MSNRINFRNLFVRHDNQSPQRGTMLLLSALVVSFALVGCSNSYISRNLSSTGNNTDVPTGVSFLYAYLQPSTPVIMKGSDGQQIESLLRVKAHSSTLAPPTTEPGIQSSINAVVDWVRVRDISDLSRTFTRGPEDRVYCAQIGNTLWDKAYERFICEYSNGSGTSTAEATGMPKLIAVEPEYGFYDKRYLDKLYERERMLDSKTKKSSTQATTVTDESSPFWPARDGLTWYRGPSYSQLDAAREIVNHTAGKPWDLIRAAHLDSGYFAMDMLRPKQLLENHSKTCLPKGAPCHTDTPADEDRVVAQKDGNHGSRTISVLAGGTAKLDPSKYPSEVTLGSSPELPVASYRITDGMPVHFVSTAMAVAISDATDNNFDVITLSQGGFPSLILRDAINKAYDEGTAIFAATGDFFAAPIIGSLTPRTVAFPARFNRVMAVAAITADHTNYSKDPCYFCLWRFWKIDSWSLRGSYGPSSAMAGHTIAAYAPNITTSVSSKQNPNAIQLDGEGVSFAVPQVAAAASMWFAKHRNEFSKEELKTWKKTEAVYQALIRSADRNFEKYSCEYMGEGALRAADALRIDMKGALGNNPTPREASTIGYKWVLDLIVSWDALKMAIALPIQGGLNSDLFRNSLKQMVLTEIQQVLHRSDKASRVFERIFPAQPGKGCPSFHSKSQYVSEFIEQLLSEEKLSDFLRRFLEIERKQIASLK